MTRVSKILATFFAIAALTPLRAVEAPLRVDEDKSKPVLEILQQNGITPEIVTNGNNKFFLLSSKNVPPQIIADIQSTTLRDMVTITDKKVFGERIIRAKNLVFNPKSEMRWEIPDTSTTGDYIVLAVGLLTLNAPTVIGDVARLNLVPTVTASQLAGGAGYAGATGWSPGVDNGQNGGPGQPGGTGGKGQTYKYPTIYIIYQQLQVNSSDKSIPALRLSGSGVVGGNGGIGGAGGNGGRAGRGTPGERKCILGICTCSSGPGDGGVGGTGGPGGRGGDGGRGGAGANLFYVAPAAQHAPLARLEVSILGVKPGTFGNPGINGVGGAAGGGGSKPFECSDGGGNGAPGSAPSPLNLGPGSPDVAGFDGSQFLANRDNSDLF